MKNFLLIIILSLILFSCGEKEEAEEETTTELEGTWKTACYTNSDNSTNIDTFIFAGNTWTIKDQRYSDTACATVYKLEEIPLTFSIGDAVTFANGKTGHKFTLTQGSTYKKTPQSDSAVSAFNSSSECSKSDWALNTEKECSTGDDAGDIYLCLYQLDGNNWYLKCDNSAYPSTSDIDTSKAEGSFTKQ